MPRVDHGDRVATGAGGSASPGPTRCGHRPGPLVPLPAAESDGCGEHLSGTKPSRRPARRNAQHGVDLPIPHTRVAQQPAHLVARDSFNPQRVTGGLGDDGGGLGQLRSSGPCTACTPACSSRLVKKPQRRCSTEAPVSFSSLFGPREAVDLAGPVALLGTDAAQQDGPGDAVLRDRASGVGAGADALRDRVVDGAGRDDPERGVGALGGGDDRVGVALIDPGVRGG